VYFTRTAIRTIPSSRRAASCGRHFWLLIVVSTVFLLLVNRETLGQDQPWKPTGSLSVGRTQHTETLLPNGGVLLAGGLTDCRGFLCVRTDRSEIYDPMTGSWNTPGRMDQPRANHFSALLPDGKVLIGGGYTLVSPTHRNSITPIQIPGLLRVDSLWPVSFL
jgi:hypothetical protein